MKSSKTEDKRENEMCKERKNQIRTTGK
jgi:hypothetical protein